MFLRRCKHRWVEARRFAHAPTAQIEFDNGLYGKEAEDAIYGWTMIELQCERCGDVTARKIPYTGDQAGGQ